MLENDHFYKNFEKNFGQILIESTIILKSGHYNIEFRFNSTFRFDSIVVAAIMFS